MHTIHRPGERKAELLLLFMVFIWAGNFPVAKYALNGINIFVFNSIRFVVATATLFVIFKSRWTWHPVVRTDLPRLLNAALLANVIYQIAFVVGVKLTTAGNAAVLLSTSPLWTIFLHAKIHREKIRPAMWAGMLLSLAGVIMIIAGSGKKMEFGGHEMVGDLVCLTAAALWGLNTNMQKPLLAHYSAIQLALIMIGIGAVGLTAIAAPAIPHVPWSSLHWTIYGAAILSGMFSIGLANLVWSYGIQRLGPGRTSNFNNLVPVAAFILSYFFLNEVVLPIQIIGAAVTVAGVWVVRR